MMLGEPDVDALAQLPLPMLLDWHAFISETNSDQSEVSPGMALNILRAKFGAK